MPGEVRALDALAVEELADGADQQRDIAVARLLDRAAVARQVERVDGAVGRQRLGVEQPVVEVAAEAVQEHERLAALALAQEPQRADADRDRLGLGARVLLGLAGNERRLELGDERVDVGVGHVGARHHGEQAADRHDVALARHAPAQHAGDGRLDDAVDLLGLDLGHLVADGHVGALLDEPLDEAALGHGQAPLGHAQLLDLRAHAGVAAPAVARTASAIVAGVGT